MIRIDTPADLAETLGLLRRLAGLTQTAVGIELGTTPQRIGDYERGKRVPNPRTTIRHLRALGYQFAIVPLIEASPETALSASVADRDGQMHTRVGVDGSDGATGLSGGAA